MGGLFGFCGIIPQHVVANFCRWGRFAVLRGIFSEARFCRSPVRYKVSAWPDSPALTQCYDLDKLNRQVSGWMFPCVNNLGDESRSREPRDFGKRGQQDLSGILAKKCVDRIGPNASGCAG